MTKGSDLTLLRPNSHFPSLPPDRTLLSDGLGELIVKPSKRNDRWTNGAAILILAAASLGSVAPASAANITACTNANQQVGVAYAYETGVEVYTIAGWWTIPAGDCITMPATPRNTKVYFFAQTANRDYVWPTATGRQFCVAGERFTYNEMQDHLPCPPGGDKRYFWPMQPTGGSIQVEFNY